MSYYGGTTHAIRSRRIRNRLLLGAVFAVALIGGSSAYAAGPVLTRSPSSIGFGNEQIGTTSFAQNVFVQNTGDAPLLVGVITMTGSDPSQFTITNDGCSGQTLEFQFSNCTFDVTFAPTTTGAKSATVNIPSNATNGTQTVGLTGVGVNPEITVSPTSVSFGNKQISTTSMASQIIVQNTGSGSGPVTISSVAIGGTGASHFTIANDGCTNATLNTQFDNCTFDVTFTPTSTGAKSATITILSNDPVSRTVTLTGTGVNPQLTVSPTSIGFGNKQTGTTSMATQVFVQNTGSGSGPIGIGVLSITGAGASQFVIENDGCSNATLTTQFDNCRFDVAFSPTSAGAKSATITIPSNDPVSRTVTLTGTGVSPQLSVSPNSIGYGSLGVGATSTPQTVFVQNSGSGGGPVTINSIMSNSSQFTVGVDECSGVTLTTTFDNCSFEVVFAPTSSGAKSGLVSISSTDPVTRTVSLTGTGVSAFTVSPSAIAFGNVQLGQTSAPRTISITSNTNSPLTFGTGTVTGPNAADFLIDEDGCSNVTLFFGGQSCDVIVQYRPGVMAAESATFQITSDQGNISVPMTGTGIDTLGPSTVWTTTNNSVRVSLLQSVNGTAADLSGVQAVNVTFTDMLGSSMTMPATLSNCNAGNKSCEFSVPVPLMLPGLVTARIDARDALGNTSIGPTITLIVI